MTAISSVASIFGTDTWQSDVDAFGGVALLNRVGEVQEITEAVIHLATASFTTGVIMAVDGGFVYGRA